MKMSPSALGTIYLSLIPIYALIYSMFPTHFYHANLNREAEYVALLHDIETRLGQQFLTYVEDWNSQPHNENGGRYFRRDGHGHYYTTYDEVSFDVQEVREQSLDLHFVFRVISTLPNFESLAEGSEPIFEENLLFIDEVSLVRLDYSYPPNDMGGLYKLSGLDYQGPYDRDLTETEYGFIHGLNSHFEELRRMSSGLSKPGWENFTRMLYFSAVTITTLGYGDISPTTQISRILIASEVVLGIVVIGMFLGAVTSKVVRS